MRYRSRAVRCVAEVSPGLGLPAAEVGGRAAQWCSMHARSALVCSCMHAGTEGGGGGAVVATSLPRDSRTVLLP